MWVATDTKEKAKFSLVPSDPVLSENLHVEYLDHFGGVIFDHEGYVKEKT